MGQEIVEQLKAVVSMQPQRLVLGQLGRHGIQPQQLLGGLGSRRTVLEGRVEYIHTNWDLFDAAVEAV